MTAKSALRCRQCNGKLELKIGWRGVKLRCMECSNSYPIDEYVDELDMNFWEKLSHRSC